MNGPFFLKERAIQKRTFVLFKRTDLIHICKSMIINLTFCCSGGASDSSVEDVDDTDYFTQIIELPSQGQSSSRTVRAKAQNLLVSWLDAGSKSDLTEATFLGELALVKLFVKFNTPIPSSAAVERLFSTGKEILRARRCKLGDNTFQTLMFMKSNLQFLDSK